MITSPAVSFPRNSSTTNPAWRNGTISTNPAWKSGTISTNPAWRSGTISTNPAWRSGTISTNPAWRNGSGTDVRIQVHSASPSDPSRQANRVPIRVLKMLATRAGHLLHPEYLQPLPSTPISPIELDAKKSPLALLAQTCSQIGKPDPPSSSSKLSSGSTNGSSDTKDTTKSGPLKMSDIGAEDKSSFKPYAKTTSSDKKDAAAAAAGDRAGYRVPSATCQPFSPRTGSPSSCTSVSPLPSTDSKEDHNNKRDSLDSNNKNNNNNNTTENNNNNNNSHRINSDAAHQEHTSGSGCGSGSKASSSDSICVTSTSSVLGGSGGLVAPVSPYKPGHPVFPLAYPGSLAGAYASYHHHHQPFLSSRDGGQLLSAQFASSLGCGSKAAGSPLAGASPPSLMSASLCRDPYCLSYHCASHLASTCGGGASHDSLKSSGYPLAMYPALHGVHPAAASSFAGHHHHPHHPLYTYGGFVLPGDALLPPPHACNWVSANGPCDKRFPSSEELLGHLRTHTAAFAGGGGAADKLLSSGYPGSSSLAAAMAASPNGSPGSPLGLRSPHHPHHPHHHHALGGLGLSGRYHPYSKSPLPPGAGGPPVQVVPGATGAYYSPYALYGQRLTTASVLGYQ